MGSDNFKFQLSVKYGQTGHLVNVRGNDITEFVAACRDLTSNAEVLMAASAAFSPKEPPASAPEETHKASDCQPTQPTYHPPVVPPGAARAGETGPLMVQLVEIKPTKTGGHYYAVSFPGFKSNTFDELLGNIAMQCQGKLAYAVFEQNGQYKNMTSIRPAA